LEKITWERGTVFVDYAHTPDALRNVIDALHVIRGAGRIITLMGCGGDRDKSKRPLMGFEAAHGSDFVVVTSDNPRSEDPVEIIRQVEEGVRSAGFQRRETQDCDESFDRGQYTIIPDRKKAIAAALRMMRLGDILLIAGKGHETYQEIRGVRYAFDDRAAAREEIARINEERERRSSAGNCAARGRRQAV
ncbi:MAG: glutamate ligase domain-containing protein, partial [Desulfomonilaceae bacterium]